MVRGAEFGRLRTALEVLGRGRGAAVAVAGEPGIGKTALLAAAVDAATAAGLPVVNAGPGAGGRLPEAPGACGRPQVVVLDDFHRLPAGSLPAVERLLLLIPARPLLVLLAYRERQLRPRHAAVLVRAADAGVLDHLRLASLSAAQARLLLGDLPDLARVHRDGGGNPLYMRVLAGGGAGAPLDTARLLGETAELSRTELQVAQAAAVFGEPFHPQSLPAVSGVDAPRTAAALDTLVRVDLVRQAEPVPLMRFRHPVVGRILADGVDPSRRRAIHLRADAELAERGAALTERAPHVARASLPGEPGQVAVLLGAAREVIDTAPDVAAEWVEAALALLAEGDGDWYQARVLLAKARRLVGRLADSRDLLHMLAPLDDAEAYATLAVYSGQAERLMTRYPEAAALARDGLAALAPVNGDGGHGRAGQAAAALHAELADVALDRQDLAAARHHADEAATLARACGDRAGEAKALAQLAQACLNQAAGRPDLDAAARAAAAAGDLVDALPDRLLLADLSCLSMVGLAELKAERFADSDRHLTRNVRLARRSGQAYELAAGLKSLGDARLLTGRLRSAAECLREAAALRPESPAILALVAALHAEALLWLRGPGDTGEALAEAERAVRLSEGLAAEWATAVRCLHAEVLLHAGQPERARQVLLVACGGPGLDGLVTWRRPRYYELLAAASVAAGEPAAATVPAEAAMAWASRLPSPARNGFAWRAAMRALAAAHGDVAEFRQAAERAAAHFDAVGMRVHVAHTLTVAASLALDAGWPDGVDGWLDRAAALAAQCGSARLARTVEDLRRTHPAASRGARPAPAGTVDLADLTTRERDVAVLASTGLTNAEIARQLYLSVRTVDSHLARIYRKLGVSTRTALTRLVLQASQAITDRPT